MSRDNSPGEPVAERIIRLSRALHDHGLPVALSETIDATRAASEIDLGSRVELRLALRSTLVKNEQHFAAFDELFDRLFPARMVRGEVAGGASNRAQGGTAPVDTVARLAAGDDLVGLATDLVDAHAGLDDQTRSVEHHLRRALRAADLARLMSEARKLDPQLSTDELRSRVEEIRRLMRIDILGQLDHSGDEIEMPLVADIDFLDASRAEFDQIRHATAPLTRKLATRLARRRQNLRGGRVDLRRTARKSIGTGGVPLDVSYLRPRPHKPELFVLCDISGSVADFSLFILTLMSALSAELPRTRSFVFVDAIDEVTELLKQTGHGIEPWQIMRNTEAIGPAGHSDYGAVLEQFWAETGDRELRQTSTVLICGDGRTNYRPTGIDALASIARRTHRVYWLNPESSTEWNTYDSEMDAYSDPCSDIFEVRTLRQLERCIEKIL